MCVVCHISFFVSIGIWERSTGKLENMGFVLNDGIFMPDLETSVFPSLFAHGARHG